MNKLFPSEPDLGRRAGTDRRPALRLSARLLLGSCAALVAVVAFAAAAQGQTPVTPRFVEETASAGITSRYGGGWEFMVGGGVATFDCNDDGRPELYMAGGTNPATLSLNESAVGGALRFREFPSGLELTGVTGAYPLDGDGDGHTDLAVLRVGENVLFRGLGGCRFERANERWSFGGGDDWTTSFAATWERGASWPTLAVGNYIDRTKEEFPWGSCTSNWLYRPARAEMGAGGGSFAAPWALKPSSCALSMLFTDWNRSGRPSLRVSNDREYYKGGQEQLWKLPAGMAPRLYSEAEGWKRLQIWGMGIASFDVTGDGYPDYFLTSMADHKLQTFSGGPTRPGYADIAFTRGVTAHRPYTGGDILPSTGWHAQFEDVNNDAMIDLFVAKGNVDSMPDFALRDPNNLLLGGPDGRFLEAGEAAGVAGSFRRGRGAAVVDLNADGLLDLAVVNRLDGAQVWRNVGSGTAAAPAPLGHWLELRPRQPGANRDAIGGWLEVRLGERTVRRELTVGGGHAGGSLGWVHFGLGALDSAQVRVRWPDGKVGPWVRLSADRFVVLSRGEAPSEFEVR